MHRPLYYFALLFLIITARPASAQHYIGMSFSEITKAFRQEKGSNVNTQDMLTFTYKDESAGNVQLKFRFDGFGKCFYEEYVTTCDSCARNLLNTILGKEKYGWKKINENQYVSKYREFLMIELPVEPEDHSFSIFRTEWNKDTYKMLTGSDQ